MIFCQGGENNKIFARLSNEKFNYLVDKNQLGPVRSGQTNHGQQCLTRPIDERTGVLSSKHGIIQITWSWWAYT